MSGGGDARVSPMGIRVEHVEKAHTLLKTQIESEARTHRCLDFAIYEKSVEFDSFNPADLFDRYIVGEEFYNYPDLFGITTYFLPRDRGGLREYHFLEYPLRVLYYSLGLLVADLLEKPFVLAKDWKNKGDVSSYYGASIRFGEPEKSEIFYQNDYFKFHRGVRRSFMRQAEHGSAALLQLDVKDFFGSVSHEVLTEQLLVTAFPKCRLRLSFQSSTAGHIQRFLTWLMNERQGLPVSKQNVISNLLAHIALDPADSFARTVSLERKRRCTFHRYVDDMFFVVPFNDGTPKSEIATYVSGLAESFAQHLVDRTQLHLNCLKSNIQIADSAVEAESLLERTHLVSLPGRLPEAWRKGGKKRTSPRLGKGENTTNSGLEEPIQGQDADPNTSSGEEERPKPQDTLAWAIDVLRRMSRILREEGIIARLDHVDQKKLKACYGETAVLYLESKEAKLLLEQVFEDWERSLTLLSPDVILFLLSRAPKAWGRFLTSMKEILGAGNPKASDLLLTQQSMVSDRYRQEFDDVIFELGASAEKGVFAGLLARTVKQAEPASVEPWIFFPPYCEAHVESVHQQVKMASEATHFGDYNLAFSHLLNAFHEWIYVTSGSPEDRKDFRATAVSDWLRNYLDFEDLQFIRQFFERRNVNGISHPGIEGDDVLAVRQIEFKRHIDELNRISELVVTRLHRRQCENSDI